MQAQDLQVGARRGPHWAIALALVFVGACAHPEPAVRITPGILELWMDGEQPRLRLSRRASEISRQHPENETFGFLFEPLGDQLVEVHLVHFLPAVPANLGAGFSGHDPEEAVSGLRSAPEPVSGARYFDVWIDRDDPLGEYRIEVYVDGRLADIVKFEVVP